MTFHNIVYHCKLCGQERVARASMECPPEQIDIFAKALCCNRCYDAREKQNKAYEEITRACHYLSIAETFKEPSRIRERGVAVIDDATRRFADGVCTLMGVTTVWEPEFVTMLAEKPSYARIILKDYTNRVRALSRNAQPEFPPQP